MKKAILYVSVSLCAAAGFQAAAQDAPKLRNDNVKEVLSAMTLEEKATLVVGQGMAGFHSNTATIGSTEVMVPGAAGTQRRFRGWASLPLLWLTVQLV